jgi:hypothetical protein
MDAQRGTCSWLFTRYSCFSRLLSAGLWAYLAIVFFWSFGSKVASSAHAQGPDEPKKTEAVYLLDVSVSMVGRQSGAQDIMNTVIDTLINDLERFQQPDRDGTIVFITFADGPHPLGPAKKQYVFDIKTQLDLLKRFLRPAVYGAFRDPETGEELKDWPGVYEATKRWGGHKTGICKSLRPVLKEFREKQEGFQMGAVEYAQAFTQELVLITDGYENVEKRDKCLAEITELMDQRYAAMQGHFYSLFMIFPPLPPGAPECPDRPYHVCPSLGEGGILPIMIPVELDRLSFYSAENLWKSAVFTFDVQLKAPEIIQISDTMGDRVEVKNFRLSDLVDLTQSLIKVATADFKGQMPSGVPEPRITSVSTMTQDLRFSIRLEIPEHNVLRERLINVSETSIRGAFLFDITPNPQKVEVQLTRKRVVALQFRFLPSPRIPAELRFQRPHLAITQEQRGSDSLALRVQPNAAFLKDLSVEQKAVRVEYDENLCSIAVDGRVYKPGETISIQEDITLVVMVGEGLAGGHYGCWVKLLPEYREVRMDGKLAFEAHYPFHVIALDREKLVFPNLWTCPGVIQGDARAVTLELQLSGGPDNWGELVIKPVEFGLAQSGIGIDVEPKALGPPFNQRTVRLTLNLKPYSQLANNKALQDAVNRETNDGHLRFEFIVPEGQLVKIKPPRLPVDLSYHDETPTIQLSPAQFDFPNVWTSAQLEGQSRIVAIRGRLSNAPDRGQISLRATGFPVRVAVRPERLTAPFPREFELELILPSATELKALSLDRLQGSIEFGYTPEGVEKCPARVEPATIPVRVDARRPQITWTIHGQPPSLDGVLQLGTLSRYRQAVTLEFSGNDVFNALPEGSITITDDTGCWVDAQGNPIREYALRLREVKKIPLWVSRAFTPDRDYKGVLTITAAADGVLINGQDPPLHITYEFRTEPLVVTIADCRRGTDLSTAPCTYQFTPNDEYKNEPTPILVEYDPPLTLFIDGRPTPSGSTLNFTQFSRLEAKVAPDQSPGFRSQVYVAKVRFSSPSGDVKINERSSDSFQYQIRLQGWGFAVAEPVWKWAFGLLVALAIGLPLFLIAVALVFLFFYYLAAIIVRKRAKPPGVILQPWIQTMRLLLSNHRLVQGITIVLLVLAIVELGALIIRWIAQ